jgi:hypothetical protein
MLKVKDPEEKTDNELGELCRSDDGDIRKSKKPRLAKTTTTSIRDAITQVIEKSLGL